MTFTRLAAGEILDRILLRLADAADDSEKLADLATHLCRPGSFDRDECCTLLNQLVSGMHRVQVGTLDGFFSRLASNFTLELGLPNAWRIVEQVEDDQIRSDAIQRLLADHPLEDLTKLVYLLGKDTALRSITREISDIVAQMYEVYRETAQTSEVWKKLPRQAELEESQLNDALALLETVPRPENKTFQKALETDLRRAAEHEWEEFIAGGVAKKVQDREATYQRVAIAPETAAAYGPLLKHARAVLVNRLAHQNEGAWRLLDHFDAAYRPLKAERRAMRFDDLTHELAAAFADGRLDDVAYRLDARTSHLLLDEFQDTSLAQWSVLRPLVRQLSEPGSARTFFCVGDVKQAIYGWRGGTAELFNSIADDVPGLVDQRLTRSFRSSPVVIELVNRVFSNLEQNAALTNFRRVAANLGWAVRRYTPRARRSPGAAGCMVGPESRRQVGFEGAKSDHAAFRRRSGPAGGGKQPRPHDRRSRAPQRSHRRLDLRTAAPPQIARERRGGQRADRFDRGRANPLAAGRGRSSGRYRGAIPRGPFAVGAGGRLRSLRRRRSCRRALLARFAPSFLRMATARQFTAGFRNWLPCAIGAIWGECCNWSSWRIGSTSGRFVVRRNFCCMLASIGSPIRRVCRSG